MKGWYEIIEQGVSEDRAIELCSSVEANMAVVGAKINEIKTLLR